MSFFFFNDTATTEIYTLSLHDALPISSMHFGYDPSLRPIKQDLDKAKRLLAEAGFAGGLDVTLHGPRDRKSTRLNSSHLVISYAVFCLKKKKQKIQLTRDRCSSHTLSR